MKECVVVLGGCVLAVQHVGFSRSITGSAAYIVCVAVCDTWLQGQGRRAVWGHRTQPLEEDRQLLWCVELTAQHWTVS